MLAIAMEVSDYKGGFDMEIMSGDFRGSVFVMTDCPSASVVLIEFEPDDQFCYEVPLNKIEVKR